jgi:DNA polymerase-3 subunit delta
MSELLYTKFSEYLKSIKPADGKNPFAPVYLIFGDELIYKGVLNQLLDVMMPPAKRLSCYEDMDGSPENLSRALEKINTYGFVPGLKIVALLDSTLFSSKDDGPKILRKIKDAVIMQDYKKAGSWLMRFLSLHDLLIGDVAADTSRLLALMDDDGDAKSGWIDDVIRHCQANPVDRDAADALKSLQYAIEKGFPDQHVLMITSETVDKRKAVYRAIVEKGMTIDCTVPKDSPTRAGKMAMEAVLNERIQTTLSKSGKQLKPAVRNALLDMTGFDLRTVTSELEKLIQYVGNRAEITEDDVNRVLKRSRKDPIYEFTNAVTDRNWEKALFFLNGLLSGELAPPQIVAAIFNQLRKLVIARDFMESVHGRQWNASCKYDVFQSRIMPEVVAYDTILTKSLQEWKTRLASAKTRPGGKTVKKGKTREKAVATDLLIAKNPANPYPVYLLLKKADAFSRERLANLMQVLVDADRRMKTSAMDPKMILEKVILEICQPDRIVAEKAGRKT